MGAVMVCIVALKVWCPSTCSRPTHAIPVLCPVQFLLSMGILGMFIGHCRWHTFVISVSLAQVSEFSFVVSSRARRMGIISREVRHGAFREVKCLENGTAWKSIRREGRGRHVISPLPHITRVRPRTMATIYKG